jgi:hypothetical protein
MSAWCDNCQRYVNQYCDRCGENFGTVVCEKYACGGTMICPICGGSTLKAKAEGRGVDPYDPRTRGLGSSVAAGAGNACKCGFTVEKTWNFCPDCGTRLG